MSAVGQINADIFWCNLNLKWVYNELLRSIYGRTQNIHLSYDVLQDAIVKFAVKNSLQPVAEPHAYLRVIVKNNLAEYYRDAAKFAPFEWADEDHALFDSDTFSSYQYSPERIADLKQRMNALEHIIHCLPPKCRQVFWLHRVEGKPQAEIAAELNISLNMVEKHMIRAMVDIVLAKDYCLRDQ